LYTNVRIISVQQSITPICFADFGQGLCLAQFNANTLSEGKTANGKEKTAMFAA
jgi:hypothetical protein